MIRNVLGVIALVLLALAMNLLVSGQQAISPWVLGPLALGLFCGLVWVALVVGNVAGRARFEGRAAGGLNAVLSSMLFFGICIVLYAFVQSWDFTRDLTREGRRDLSPQTVQVLRGMAKEVKVLCFFIDVQDELVLIARDKTLRFLDQCRKHTDLLKVEMLDPQVDRQRLESLQVTHTSPQGTVIITAGTKQRVITLSGGSPRMEERDFTNALVNVLRDAEPKVCFLTGHHERDILDETENGASMLKNLLEGESYKTDRIGIKITAPEIPSDCDILVLNNPTGDLHPQEMRAASEYVDRGGRLFMMIDPWKSVRAGSGSEQMRPWLESHCGIVLGSDMAISDQQKVPWQMELTTDKRPFQSLDSGFLAFQGSFFADHPITRGFGQTMVFMACRTVRAADKLYDGVSVTPLLRTTPDFWGETDVAKVAETRQAQHGPNETSGPLTLAVAASIKTAQEQVAAGRPREARVVVVGDSEFASNEGMHVPGNFNFVLNTFAWLSERDELIAIRASGKEDVPIVLSSAQQRAIAWVSILFTVQVVVIAGLLMRWNRRKHQ